MQIEAEIFYGGIGTVRNELSLFLKEQVQSIHSLTQSVTPTGNNTNPMITIVLLYVPVVEKQQREHKKNEEYIN